MSDPLFSLLVSTGVLLCIVLFFRFERRRGARLIGGVRNRFDYMVLRIRHGILVRARVGTRFVVKQIMHYFVHTILSVLRFYTERSEQFLRGLIRSNKTLARKSERERTHRTKLEEIVLHKMEITLSEEERKKHKKQILHM